MDLEKQRKLMLDEQIVKRGIKDERVLAAFLKVPRHEFLKEENYKSAYGDFPLPIGEGQTISQPFIVALMTESLGLTGNEKVLEIGTGSGYQTAVLAELAQEIFTVEKFSSLSKEAQETLGRLGYKNIKFKVGDGSSGWPEESPFDRIIITAASPRVPLPLTEQLQESGKMVLPLGSGMNQILTLVEKKQGNLEYKDICSCVFVPLVGKYGFRE